MFLFEYEYSIRTPNSKNLDRRAQTLSYSQQFFNLAWLANAHNGNMLYDIADIIPDYIGPEEIFEHDEVKYLGHPYDVFVKTDKIALSTSYLQ